MLFRECPRAPLGGLEFVETPTTLYVLTTTSSLLSDIAWRFEIVRLVYGVVRVVTSLFSIRGNGRHLGAGRESALCERQIDEMYDQ